MIREKSFLCCPKCGEPLYDLWATRIDAETRIEYKYKRLDCECSKCDYKLSLVKGKLNSQTKTKRKSKCSRRS